MMININQNYSQFYRGTEQIKSYGATDSKKDTLVEGFFCVIEKIYMKDCDGDGKGKSIWYQKETSLVFKENAARLPVAGKKYLKF